MRREGGWGMCPSLATDEGSRAAAAGTETADKAVFAFSGPAVRNVIWPKGPRHAWERESQEQTRKRKERRPGKWAADEKSDRSQRERETEA